MPHAATGPRTVHQEHLSEIDEMCIENAAAYCLNSSGMRSMECDLEEYEALVTSLEDPEVDNFQVYPNPVLSGNDIKIRLKSSQLLEKVRLMNTLGQIVYQHQYNTPQPGASINTSALKPGLYVLQMSGNGLQETTQVIIR